MEPDIVAGLDDLAARLRHLRELLEWQLLFEQESSFTAGGFRRNDSTPEDIAIAYGAFISLTLDLQAVLDGSIPEATLMQRRTWQSQLQTLVRECHDLAVPERFINR